jgi:amino acid adenylation domain-containing protein
MLFHSAYSPETAVYHDIFSFHLRTALHVETLRASIQEMSRRYPVLRTSFDLSEFSEPLQLVHVGIDVPLHVEDLRGLAHDEQEAAIRAWVGREHAWPFDFKRPPLFRVQLHRRSDDTFQFSFSFHHAILDGWSVAVLLTELFQHYLASMTHQVLTLPPPPASAFQQFIALEREAIASPEQRAFWEHYLEGTTVSSIARWPLAAPTGEVRRVVQYEAPLTPALSDEVTRLVQTMGVPLKSALLAAHVRVTGLVSGTTDVLTGLVANGRPEEEDGERAVGLFLNTLPHRMRLPGGSWRALVQAVYESEHELLPYRRFPLVEIQKIKGGRQLFESAFYFVHFHITETLAGVDGLESLSAEFYEETNFTLVANFSLDPSTHQVRLRLIHDPTQLNADQIALIGGYYVAALDEMTRHPDSRYETACLLTHAEQHQIVDAWNATVAAYPEASPVQALIEQQVARSPEALAVVHDGQRLTYRELNERANQLGWYLREQGVGPDVLVGICVERSLEMVVGLLGILKAGGAYLPLDPDYPTDRLRYMVEDARPALVLTQERLEARLTDLGAARLLCLDRDWPALAAFGTTNPPHLGSADDQAYMIYTSGSSGRPKGVMVTQRALVNFLCSMQGTLAVRPDDVLAAVTTLSFDIAGLELYLPLIAGARIQLIDRETARDGHELHETLIQHAVTIMQATPSTWSLLELDGWKPRAGFTILCGGEALSRELAAQLVAHRVPVWNLYGPTETTIWSCAKRLSPDQADTITIGTPIANTQVYVLDHDQQVAPTGVAGELYIGGAGLARGYLHRPDLTAERFVPDALSAEAGGRLYRTGDLVRFRPDGELEFLGRVDQQVKIRGFRIELGEIEAELMAHVAIRQAVVIARPGITGDNQLVAYLVRDDQPGEPAGDARTLTIAALREYLATRVPEYMIPSQYVFLDQLPLTPNGKIDRKQLPEPDPNLRPEDRVYVAPRTKIEEAIAAIWTELLGVERISVNDGFFELGGDSLLISRLVARIHRVFDVNLPIRSIFLAPTLKNIATAVKAQRALKNDQSYVEDFLEELSDDQVDALLRETASAHEAPPSGAATTVRRSQL